INNASSENRAGKNFPINLMKTLLIISLCSVTLALTSFAQAPSQPQNAPPPVRPPAPPAANAQAPAVPPAPAATAAVTHPVAPAPTAPGAPLITGTTPATTVGPVSSP